LTWVPRRAATIPPDASIDTPMAKRILVIEDEPQMLLGLRDNLEIEGYEVITATDGEAGLAMAIASTPDLIVLDVSVPRKSGFEVCRELRTRTCTTPVVMLTGRTQETERVLGLNVGADDCVSKPFSILELIARIRAVLRRVDHCVSPETCHIGDIEINFRNHQAHQAGRRVDFTMRELALLRHLVAHTGQVVTRHQILEQVLGFEHSLATRTVDNFVVRLRQKLENTPHEPKHILTIHGEGYKFVG
jgi:DNA-binding response OmpR family regulator